MRGRPFLFIGAKSCYHRRRAFRRSAGWGPRPYEESPAGENVSVHHFFGQINDNAIMLSKTSSNIIGCPWNSARSKYVVYSENRVFLSCPDDGDDDYDDYGPAAPLRRKRFCKHYSRSLTTTQTVFGYYITFPTV